MSAAKVDPVLCRQLATEIADAGIVGPRRARVTDRTCATIAAQLTAAAELAERLAPGADWNRSTGDRLNDDEIERWLLSVPCARYEPLDMQRMAREIKERRSERMITSDEVRAVVRGICIDVLGPIGVRAAHIPATAIADRVAEKLAGRHLAAAFDSASHAITGLPAAELDARLDIEQRAYPSPGFDTSDVVPVESIGNWDPADDQTTTPAPLKTMAEVQSDGGERPRVTESNGADE